MAPPSDLTEATEATNEYTIATERSTSAVISHSDAVTKAGQSYVDTSGRILQGGKVVGQLAQQFTASGQAINLFTTATLHAQQAFANFTNLPGLNTFGRQIDNLFDTLSKGSIAQTAPALTKIGDLLVGMGVKQSKLNELVSLGPEAVMQFAKTYLSNMSTMADNAIRTQGAIIKLSAGTGELGKVINATGDNFENINMLIDKTNNQLAASAGATHTTMQEMREFYTQLGTVPGALSAVSQGSAKLGGQTSMLTSSVALAIGTGRNYNEVIGDLQSAFRDYSITGDQALQFSSRMTEVTNNLGVEFGTVHKALLEVNNQFKSFADAGEHGATMSEGLAEIMNSMSKSLEGVGVSGTHAVDIVESMTKQVSNLNIAQKAFLSAQTGGPGGLMGAFQIDKMLREGDIKGVFDKVKQQITRQVGQIVTLDEAARNPAAAAQLTRQMMILQQGPLGKFAQTDQDAQRILEALKKGGPTQELTKDFMTKSMDRGVSIQEKSNSILQQILEVLQQATATAETPNLEFLQKFTTGTGNTNLLTPGMANLRSRGEEFGRQQGMFAGEVTRDIRSGLNGAGMADSRQKHLEHLKRNFNTTMDTVSSEISNILQSFQKHVMSKDTAGENADRQNLINEINRKKEAANKLDKNSKERELQNIKREEEVINRKMAESHMAAQVMASHDPAKIAAFKSAYPDAPLPPGINVRHAAASATRMSPILPGMGTAQAPLPPGATERHDVHLQVTAVCEHCKRELERKEIDPHTRTVNPTMRK